MTTPEIIDRSSWTLPGDVIHFARLADLNKRSAMSYEQAQVAIRLENSYSRLGAIMGLRPLMEPADWWRLLGEQWTGCDNIAAHRVELRALMRKTPRDLWLSMMMQPQEAARLAALPTTLVVYRGCYVFNRHGLSWTLDKAIARRFVTLNRYRQPTRQPLLLTGVVQRGVAVLKDDRNEQEIVSPHVRVFAIDKLPRAPVGAQNGAAR